MLNSLKLIKKDIFTIFLSFSLVFMMIKPNYINIVLFVISSAYLIFLIEKNNLNNFNENWFWFGIIIFLYLLTISLYSDFKTISILKSFHFLLFLIFASAIKNFILNDFEKKILFSKIIFYITLFIIVDVIIQKYLGQNIFGQMPTSSNRLTGPFIGEPIPGSILSKFFIFSLFFINVVNFKSINKFTLNILFLAILTFSIIITTERSAIVGFIFILFFSFIFVKKFRLILITALMLILVTFIFLYKTDKAVESKTLYTLQSVGIDVKSLRNTTKKDHRDKYYFAKTVFDNPYGVLFITSIEIWKKNKLFGQGIRSYRYECAKIDDEIIKKFVPNYYHKKCNTHPHNLYLEILSETGLFGLILFIYLFVYFLVKAIKNLRYVKDEKKRLFCIFSLFSFIYVIFPLKTSGSFFSSLEGGLNWMLIGIFLSSIKIIQKRNEKL